MKDLGLGESMSNLTSTISIETSISSSNAKNDTSSITNNTMLYAQQASSSSFVSQSQAHPPHQPSPTKKKRSLPGNPDPQAEVIALSPKSLLATNRFICEICNKGFQRDQNLQLHRRGHNLPWKLKLRANKDEIIKKVYVCPEPSCVHHDPSRALGDLTGIKKHFCRKHGEKKWKCDKCSKKYAVLSDWKAHSKICGTREYRCDCGTLFSRRDSFITHRAFCDALAEESARGINPLCTTTLPSLTHQPNMVSTTTSHVSSLPSFPMKREQIDNIHASNNNMVSMRQDLPPLLACPPPPLRPPQQSALDQGHHHVPESFDHQSQSSAFQVQYNHHHNSHHQSAPTLNNVGPTLSSFRAPLTSHPHMSATALLQRAAEMGVTISNHHHQQQHRQMTVGRLTSSSQEEEQHHQTLEMNTSVGQSSMLHDNVTNMLMNSMQTTSASSMFDSSDFGEFHHQTMTPTTPQLNGGGGGGGKGDSSGGAEDRMTRDFLGLKTFSHKDFLDMARLGQMSSSSSASFDQQQQDQHNQTPW